MRAEIISIGTELLLGRTINSDAALVARELATHGIDLFHVQTVGDNAARLAQALELALSRSDLVITTGGLGPTTDDLTREVVATVTGCPLEEDPESLARLHAWFGDNPLDSAQLRQVMVPRTALVFANEHGTAPGCGLTTPGGRHIALLPGPPRELEPMLEGPCRQWLERLAGGVLEVYDIRTFGIGEGAAASRLEDLAHGANPTVATYAADGEMFVRVSARAASADQARQLAAPVVEEVSSRLGEFIYGVNVPSLAWVVLDLLRGTGASVATAESCTGGLLARLLTDVPGASEVFGAGLVTYANWAKRKFLDIPGAMLKTFGAVSPETARAMAAAARRRCDADYGLGISGIAGPDGGSPEKPVGLVYIALDDGGENWLRTMRTVGRYRGRAWTRQQAASNALDLLRRRLLRLPMQAEGLPVVQNS